MSGPKLGNPPKNVEISKELKKEEYTDICKRNAVEELLEERGLRLSGEKTILLKGTDGFDFVSYHFRQADFLCTVTPSHKAILSYEERLQKMIMNSKVSLDTLIRTLNKSLLGFSSYHRIHDCEKSFRHIDVLV